MVLILVLDKGGNYAVFFEIELLLNDLLYEELDLQFGDVELFSDQFPVLWNEHRALAKVLTVFAF